MHQIFPYFPHSFGKWDFLDPFSGPANIPFFLPGRYKTETIWELVGEVVSLLLQLRDGVEELIRELNSEPFSVQGMYEHDRGLFLKQYEWEQLPQVVRAARFFRLCWNRYRTRWRGPDNRDPGSYVGSCHIHRPEKRILPMRRIGPDELRWFSQRLEGINIRCGDSVPTIRDYMMVKSAFVFLDPPYPGESVYIGQEAPSVGWFAGLVNILDGPEVRAWWLMTLPLGDPEIEELIPSRWHRKPLEGAVYRVGRCVAGMKTRKSSEILFSNRPLVAQATLF